MSMKKLRALIMKLLRHAWFTAGDPLLEAWRSTEAKTLSKMAGRRRGQKMVRWALCALYREIKRETGRYKPNEQQCYLQVLADLKREFFIRWKRVKNLRLGDVVRPGAHWDTRTASVQARVYLDPNKGYKVTRGLNGVWLGLEPGRGMATTIVYALFKDPDEKVQVGWRG